MGYTQNNSSGRCDATAISLGWEPLGRIIQALTLEAVAQHFFDRGVAELCVEALARASSESSQRVEHE